MIPTTTFAQQMRVLLILVDLLLKQASVLLGKKEEEIVPKASASI